MGVCLEYYVQLHKCLVANSIQEAAEKVKAIASEFRMMLQWEKEGKIKVDEQADHVDERGFQYIQVLDESIGLEIRKMQLITFYEVDLDYIDPGLCSDLDEDYSPPKSKASKKRKGGK